MVRNNKYFLATFTAQRLARNAVILQSTCAKTQEAFGVSFVAEWENISNVERKYCVAYIACQLLSDTQI